jgi:hypothetical protein
MGEALATQLAVSLAISLDLSQVIIEGDSQIVIFALQDPSIAQDWKISSIIHYTIDTISPHLSWSAWKVDRSVNLCAHYIAQRAAASVTPGSILSSSPSYLSPGSSIQIVSKKDPPFKFFPYFLDVFLF